MTYDGETEGITTFCGGLLTIIVTIIGYVYLGQQSYIMYMNTNVDFMVSDQIVDPMSMKGKSLADYAQSFNFILGAKVDIDIFDNPYFEINVYEMSHIDDVWTIKKSENIKLIECTYEDKKIFLSDFVMQFYPKGVCFADKS